VGKTTLTKFVAWKNQLGIYQIRPGRNYTVKDFDADLRDVMHKSGCKKEQICFIFDESNVLSNAFLERMNALLAGGEVPGLFEGDVLTALLNDCRNAWNTPDLDDDETYKKFTK
jgi:dynein heavy chain 1, cytosolic